MTQMHASGLWEMWKTLLLFKTDTPGEVDEARYSLSPQSVML